MLPVIRSYLMRGMFGAGLFQTLGEAGTVLDIPQANRFSADSDTPLSEEILNITVTEVESIVEPDGVGYDIGREPMAFISIHRLILAATAG
jgi:hypothetical protein